MSEPVNGNGQRSQLQFWLTLFAPCVLSIAGVFFATWSTTQKLQEQLEQDRMSNNAKFEAINLRVGNQDALITSLAALTGRLDERMKAMSDTNATISARRDQQFDNLAKALDAMRDENALGRERDARLETKVDSVLGALDARPLQTTPRTAR